MIINIKKKEDYNIIKFDTNLRRRLVSTEDYVKFIFSKMVCSCCNEQFTPECVEIIRVEGNTAIVKIECTNCHKNYGIAVVGIETVGDEIDEDTDHVIVPDLPAITFNDVLDAHKFIDKLGADWMKYIPKEFKNEKID